MTEQLATRPSALGIPRGVPRSLPGWSWLPIAAGTVAIVDAGGTDDGPGLCVIRRCTGGYCPGCGVTRAARHLVHREWAAAWHDHPWLVLVVAQVLVGAAIAGVLGMTRHLLGRSPAVPWWRSPRVVLGFGIGNVALSFGIWAARLADGSIPAPF